jgi:hypothetical protein
MNHEKEQQLKKLEVKVQHRRRRGGKSVQKIEGSSERTLAKDEACMRRTLKKVTTYRPWRTLHMRIHSTVEGVNLSELC